jgi:hypothetical protein
MKRTISLAVLAFGLLALSGCYYDNEQDLYPGIQCDTSNVTYSGTIAPILNANCVQCHNSVSPSNNIDLSTYDGVHAVPTSILIGVITWQSGYPQMPKGGSQLPSCDISKIEIWIRNGEPNN